MQSSASTMDSRITTRPSAVRQKTEAVVEALESLGTVAADTGTLPEVTHDVRNMVTALSMYCDLLEEPGVLATPFSHYARELRLILRACLRLVEKLAALETQNTA
jgi:hypothetical protein